MGTLALLAASMAQCASNAASVSVSEAGGGANYAEMAALIRRSSSAFGVVCMLFLRGAYWLLRSGESTMPTTAASITECFCWWSSARSSR